jgi:hypothetical protein
MLKKFFHIVLALMMLIATVGLTLNLHYCRNRLVSSGITFSPKACCDKKCCCHNESRYLRVDESSVISEYTSPGYPDKIVLLNYLPAVNVDNLVFFNAPGIALNLIAHSPPLKRIRSSHLCCFLL